MEWRKLGLMTIRFIRVGLGSVLSLIEAGVLEQVNIVRTEIVSGVVAPGTLSWLLPGDCFIKLERTFHWHQELKKKRTNPVGSQVVKREI